MEHLATKITTMTHQNQEHAHLWIIAHKWTDSIPKKIRNNADFCAFSKTAVQDFGHEFIGSASSRDAVVKWGSHTFQPMLKVVNKAVKARHDYLVVNKLVQDEKGENTLYLNFTHRVDPRPQNGTGGRSFLARTPILLPDNLRVDVPVDGTGTALLLRQYCADNPLSAPSADLALDPNSSSIFSRGACFRVFCRVYPSHSSAQSPSSSIGQQNGCGGGVSTHHFNHRNQHKLDTRTLENQNFLKLSHFG